MATASDDFAGDGALSGSWTNLQGSIVRRAGAAAGGNATAIDCAYVWNANTFGAEQFIECTITNTDSGDYYYGGIVRSATGAVTFYEIAVNTTESYLYRWVAGTPTLLDQGDGISGTNRVLRMEASGTGATVTLTITVDGSPLGNIGTAGVVTDSTGSRLTSGQVGIAGYMRSDNTSGQGIQSWSGGDLGGGGGGDPTPLGMLLGVGT